MPNNVKTGNGSAKVVAGAAQSNNLAVTIQSISYGPPLMAVASPAISSHHLQVPRANLSMQGNAGLTILIPENENRVHRALKL